MKIHNALMDEALKQLGFDSNDYFKVSEKFKPIVLEYYMNLAFTVGYELGLKKTIIHNNTNNMKSVAKLDNNGRIIETYQSATEAAEANKTYSGTLIRAIKLKYKCSGFRWQYL